MKFKLLFSYRFLLLILSVLGVYLQLTKHGGFGMMLYYTIYPTCWSCSLWETWFGAWFEVVRPRLRATFV